MTNQNSSTLAFVELTDLQDPLLLPWFDLFEAAFPQDERMPVSLPLRVLQQNTRGEPSSVHILAGVEGEDHKLVSMACYNQLDETGVVFLWYLAVQPGLRSSGIGSQTYRFMLDQISPKTRMVMFDVERPDLAKNEEERRIRERRIEFYRRFGARILCGIRYEMRSNPVSDPLPMNLMIHPLGDLTPREAFDLAKRSLDVDGLDEMGELSFG